MTHSIEKSSHALIIRTNDTTATGYAQIECAAMQQKNINSQNTARTSAALQLLTC